jgi:hypothetical protein
MQERKKVAGFSHLSIVFSSVVARAIPSKSSSWSMVKSNHKRCAILPLYLASQDEKSHLLEYGLLMIYNESLEILVLKTNH